MKKPAPVHLLPSGKDHATIQFMLPTFHIEEATYDGNVMVMDEILKYLGFDSEEKREEFGRNGFAGWIGDLLTVSRMEGLSKFRSEDHNSFDRMDWGVWMFGFFHLVMAFASSMYSQYLGTQKGRGLKHGFTILNRKGLTSAHTKGPFHHMPDVQWT